MTFCLLPWTNTSKLGSTLRSNGVCSSRKEFHSMGSHSPLQVLVLMKKGGKLKIAVLQIKRGNKDNYGIMFLIFL